MVHLQMIYVDRNLSICEKLQSVKSVKLPGNILLVMMSIIINGKVIGNDEHKSYTW